MEASPFRTADDTLILLLANSPAPIVPVGALPPAAAIPNPLPVEDINPFTQDDQEMLEFYAIDNSAHTHPPNRATRAKTPP